MNCDYVAFEGIDGSGKSSIIEQLSKILDEKKMENKIVREPGGTKVGEGIRELLLSHDYKVSPLTEALLFCAQRSQLVDELIKPSIKNGIRILSDRSAYSSVAYQGVGRGLGDRIGSDKIEFFQRIREGYLRLSKEFFENFLVLDAENSLEVNLFQVCDWLGIDKAK